MRSIFGSAFKKISGEWHVNRAVLTESKDLHTARIDSSRPTLGFFGLLICSAVIASLGLIANSAAVVIGAMVIAPLMEPILSLAFGLAITDQKLVKRSATTLLIGVITVVGTAWILAEVFGASVVNQEITNRTAPNLIDLVIAVAAGAAGAITITHNKANSIAGVAIAVALVPPLCVCGIGISLGSDLIVSFGRGTVTGLSNQVSEGSFLLFLANMIGITVTSLTLFVFQGYGNFQRAWRNLLVWIALLGLLSVPLSSALKEFRMQQDINIGFSRLKAGLQGNNFDLKVKPETIQNIRILYINAQITGNSGVVEVVMNAPKELLDKTHMNEVQRYIKRLAIKDYGLKEVEINISIIPNQIINYPSTTKVEL